MSNSTTVDTKRKVNVLEANALPADDRATDTSAAAGKRRKQSAATTTSTTTIGAAVAHLPSGLTPQSTTTLVNAQIKDDLRDKFDVDTEVLSIYILMNYYWKTKRANSALADASIAMARTRESDRNKHLT